MKFKRIFSMVAFLISAALLVGCWYSYSNTRQWLSGSKKTQGEVVSVRKQTSYDRKKRKNKTMFYPIVGFQAPTGQRIEFESSIGTNPQSHSIGDRVDVYYQPMQPADARLGDFWDLWFLPIVLGFMGVVFMTPVLILSFTRTGQ